MGFRSGDWAGHDRVLMWWSFIHTLTDLAVWHGTLCVWCGVCVGVSVCGCVCVRERCSLVEDGGCLSVETQETFKYQKANHKFMRLPTLPSALSLYLTHTHSHAHTRSHTLPHTPMLTHAPTRSHTLPHTPILTHAPTHSHTLPCSHTLTHSTAHTHTPTQTRLFSFVVPRWWNQLPSTTLPNWLLFLFYFVSSLSSVK